MRMGLRGRSGAFRAAVCGSRSRTGSNCARKTCASSRAALRQRTDAIRADKCLKLEAKSAAIAREYLQTKGEIQALQSAEATERDSRQNELKKSLFGAEGFTTAQDAISYRDAQDRAHSLTVNAEDRALTLLRRAELAGDNILTMALVNRALEAGWVQVANSYIETNPFQGQRLEELWTLQDPDPVSPAALQAQTTAEARLRETRSAKITAQEAALAPPT